MRTERTVTMKKLIELDAALDALRDVIVPAEDIGFGDELTDGYNDGINMAITVVIGLPAVDAVPVKHGEWQEENRRPRSSVFYCSICHRTAYDIQPTRENAWK